MIHEVIADGTVLKIDGVEVDISVKHQRVADLVDKYNEGSYSVLEVLYVYSKEFNYWLFATHNSLPDNVAYGQTLDSLADETNESFINFLEENGVEFM
ncbi:hypothetical protein [Vibrio phage YC]|uniref:Uncharacterized protein n=1 Tax=Vibrio phage YC TaxID=2267403 RepID=A0A384ZS62_9CAUD|nr:hypothetical protein HWB64_gp085 [Vibrio phage YC]AXC34454.1 hypothetical protein [Vibrio phage YC]